MVTGPLRGVLWLLGSLAAVWLVLSVLAFPAMGRMMGGGMMQGGMMAMPLMMLGMGAGFLALLGLVGVLVFLIVDSLRQRSSADPL